MLKKIEQDGVDFFEKQINKLLWMLGYDPRDVLVTDLATFLDFTFEIPTSELVKQHVNSLLHAEGLDITVEANQTLVDAARLIVSKYPQWPDNTDQSKPVLY